MTYVRQMIASGSRKQEDRTRICDVSQEKPMSSMTDIKKATMDDKILKDMRIKILLL